MGSASTKQHSVLTKIRDFLQLKPGWHFGEGKPPDKNIIERALFLAERAIAVLFNIDAFPGIDGEIMVTIYHYNHYLEFTFETDNSVTYVHEKDGKEVCYQEHLSFEIALKELDNFCEQIWNSSELSTASILTQEEKSLKV